jgi:heme-degrading monooxygenase HmoA
LIARVWTARTTRELMPAYRAHLRAKVFPELKGIAGWREVLLLSRETEGAVDVQVITLWDSVESIRAFAGDDLEAAVVSAAAAALFTEHDQRTRHFEVEREGA